MTDSRRPISPRLLALRIIEETLSGKKAQEAFSQLAEKSGLDIQDRQLCADLVYGYLRMRIKLDFILTQFLRKPGKLPQSMLILLALGLYSLLFQEKIPSYAAINETVKEIRKNWGQTLANVANGVLRGVQKVEKRLCEEDWYREKTGDELKGYSLFHSLPEAVVKLWMDSYGREEALELMKRSAGRPWQGVRVNARHENAEELKKRLSEAEKGISVGEYGFAFPPGAYITEVAGRTLADWTNEGALSLQSPGSMLIVEEMGLADLKGAVWDCCAGSGIKSASLLERGVDVSLASDVSRQRLENIKPFCVRLGLEPPEIVQASASCPPLKSWKGHIIADVPCSGLGVLARRPDIRANVDKENFWLNHVRTQKEIMAGLVSLLEDGKKLVYITCTLNPYENGLLVREILRAHPELTLEKEWQSPPDCPWLEGMYGAALIKTSA